jgi:hypothetical protein
MADARDSFSHASPESLRRRADSWSRTPVIMFDSIEGKLYRVPESEAEGMRKENYAALNKF